MKRRIWILGLAMCVSMGLSGCGSVKLTVNGEDVVNISNTTEAQNSEKETDGEKSAENKSAKNSESTESSNSDSNSNSDETSKRTETVKEVTNDNTGGVDKYWNISGVELQLTDDTWEDTTPETDKFVCKQFTATSGKNKDAVVQVVLADSDYKNFTITSYAEKYGNNYQTESITLDDGSSAILYSWIDKANGQVIEKMITWPFNAQLEVTLVYNLSSCDGTELNKMLYGIKSKDADLEAGMSHERIGGSLSEEKEIEKETEEVTKEAREINNGSSTVNSQVLNIQDHLYYEVPESWKRIDDNSTASTRQYLVSEDGANCGLLLLDLNGGSMEDYREIFVNEIVKGLDKLDVGMEIKYGTNGSNNKSWDTVDGFTHTALTLNDGSNSAFENIYYKSNDKYCAIIMATTPGMEPSSDIMNFMKTIEFK